MSMHGPCMCSVLSSEGLSWLWRRPDRTLKLPVWIKVPPRWLFAPSLSQLLANDPSIISDTQSADKWRDLDEIKDNCNISLIDRPRQFLPARGAETKKWTEGFWALSKETFGKKIYIQSDIQNRNYNLLIHQPITVQNFFLGGEGPMDNEIFKTWGLLWICERNWEGAVTRCWHPASLLCPLPVSLNTNTPRTFIILLFSFLPFYLYFSLCFSLYRAQQTHKLATLQLCSFLNVLSLAVILL